MTSFTLHVTLDDTTRASLKASGYNLYAMCSVTSSNRSGLPLVACAVGNLFQTNLITIDADLMVYVSSSQLAVDNVIQVNAQCGISSGQQAIIDSSGSFSTRSLPQAPASIWIVNNSGSPCTVGSGRTVQGQATPVVGFSAENGETVALGSSDQVLLFFATSTYTLGAVLEVALGQGLLVDLSSLPTSPVTPIPYSNAAGGWNIGSATWGKIYDSGTDLT